MRCNNCNAFLKDNELFCPHCGQKIPNNINDTNLSVTSKELRRRAFKSFENTFFFFLAAIFVAFGISAIPLAGLIVFGPIMVGLNALILYIIRKREKPEFITLFDGFKKVEKHVVLGLLQALFIFLWSLLFIIPGIIKRYSYSMSNFIAVDKPELSPSETIDESILLMNGNKFRLFVLHLSFIGWFILSIFTLGVGFLFLIPYIKLSESHFYLELTKSYEDQEILKIDEEDDDD